MEHHEVAHDEAQEELGLDEQRVGRLRGGEQHGRGHDQCEHDDRDEPHVEESAHGWRDSAIG